MDVIWETDELMVRKHPDGDLEFIENPKINTHFIRIYDEELISFARHWLDLQGYDVTRREPEILPCPLCKSKEAYPHTIKVDFEDGIAGDYTRYQCNDCGVTTEGCLYENDARDLWNALPRKTERGEK